MNKKHIFIIVGFVLLSMILLPVGYRFYKQYKEQNLRGEYAFSTTRQNIRRLAGVEINSAENGTVSLRKKDSVWHFVQASDYFANSEAVAELYKMINTAVISSVVPADFAKQKLLTENETKNAAQRGVEIKTYDSDGVLLDSAVISKQDKSDQYILRYEGGHYTYLISSGFEAMEKPQTWVPYPLLSVLPEHILQIKSAERSISAAYIRQNATRNLFLQNLLMNLQLVEYDGIIKKTDAPEVQNLVPRHWQIVTPVGLIYDLNIYKDSLIYWLEIGLSSVKIPHKEVPEFIQNNQRYFDQWFFMLNDLQGELFYEAPDYFPQES